jgi:hypothetical protein
MLFREMIAVYSEKKSEIHKYTVWQNAIIDCKSRWYI